MAAAAATTHIAGGKYDRRDTAAIQKDPWVEWAEGLPTNERVEEGLQWLAGELRAAEKAAHVDEVGRRLLVDAQRAVEQLARLQREKNPEAHLQTALREALLLRHDLREQAAHAPFRLSPDPHLARLHDLSRAAALLARDLVGEAVTQGRFAGDVAALLQVVGDLFEAGQQAEAVAPTLEAAVPHRAEAYRQAVAAMEAEGGPPSQADQYPLHHHPAAAAAVPHRARKTSDEEAALPSISQMTKGKVVPPSTNALAGPSADLPEVLPTAADRPLAIYPGTHTVPSVPPMGLDQPAAEDLQPRDRRLSDEQLDDFYRRFVCAFNALAQNESSKKILSDEMALLRQLWGVAPSLESGASSLEQVLRNEHLAKALRSAKGLLESFLGGRTLDSLVYRLVELYELTLGHKQALEFFASAGDYLAKVLAHPDLLSQDAYRAKGLHLLKRLREVNDTVLKGRLTGLVAEMSLLAGSLAAETSLRELKDSVALLARDLALSPTGRFAIKPHMWSQLHTIIAHGVRERWQVPLPDILLQGDLFEARVMRGRIAARHLVPRELLIEDRGKMLVGLSDLRQPKVKATANGIRLSLRGINVDMHNALVTFKSGGVLQLLPSALKWPLSFLPLPDLSVAEAGKLSVLMGGDGMDLFITLRTHISADTLFEIERVSCRVNNLDLFISGTKHDALYNAILTTFAGRWRQEIEAAIQDTIKASLEQLHNGLAGSLLHDLLAQALAPIKDATQLAKLVEALLASPSVQEELVPGMLKGTLFPAEDAQASARTAK